MTLPDRVVDWLRRVVDRPPVDESRYEIQEEIGRGGGGVVWSAYDRLLERTVALKVVDQEAGEARTIARLEHPGIVPVYDCGRLDDGRAFYTMKLIDGERLDAHAARLTLAGRLRLFLEVCDAVAFAHSRGTLHRDLKPANIMAGAFGEVLVLDWGVAARGTPGYMAPEVAHGEEATVASDVYSLGATLEGLIEPGRRPLVAIVARAKSPDPEQRYASAEDLRADVARYLDGEPVTVYQEGFLERLERFVSRNRVLILLIGVYTLVRLLLALWRGLQ